MLDWSSRPAAYNFNIISANPKGPTPGAVAVATTGTAIDLSQLTNPGVAFIFNQGRVSGTPLASDYVQLGIRDITDGRWYPLLRFPYGHGYPVELAMDLLESFTGTGTTAAVNQLWAKASPVAQNLVVEAFEQ